MFNFNEYQRPYNPYDKLVNAFMNIFNRNERPRETSNLSNLMDQYQNPYDYRMQQGNQSQIGQRSNIPNYNIPFQKTNDLSGDLMGLLRQRESKGNYGIRNNLGFTGAYQFGAPALEDVGLLKKGAGRLGNKALKNPSNWLIPGGMESFLANKTIQDEAMNKLLDRNRQTLKKMGLIKENTPKHLVNAMLAAAHLGGPGGVKNYLRGINSRDAYGTPISEYFNLGMGAS